MVMMNLRLACCVGLHSKVLAILSYIVTACQGDGGEEEGEDGEDGMLRIN